MRFGTQEEQIVLLIEWLPFSLWIWGVSRISVRRKMGILPAIWDIRTSRETWASTGDIVLDVVFVQLIAEAVVTHSVDLEKIVWKEGTEQGWERKLMTKRRRCIGKRSWEGANGIESTTRLVERVFFSGKAYYFWIKPLAFKILRKERCASHITAATV